MKRMLMLLTTLFLLQSSLQAANFKTEQWQTANGTHVVFYQAMEVPMLDISIAFAAGSAYDGPLFGLAALTGQLLHQGNANLNATQIAEKLADTGAQFDSETSRDMSRLQLKTLTTPEAMKQAVDTFALIINKPAFRQDMFNRQKSQQLIALTQAQESPENVANLLFFNKLYHNHPYAHPINGTAEALKKISVWQVRDFYKRHYVGSNAVMVLVGAIDSEKAHAVAEQLTSTMPKGQAAAAIPKAVPLAAAEKITENFPSSQTMLRLGQVSIAHNNPDYFPLMVGNYILGGGALVSRLSNEVREKRGLTYGIISQFMPMPGDGPFLISFSTKNSQAGNAMKITLEVLTSFLTSGPDEEELTAAKQYLTGSFPLSLSGNSNIAGMLLRMAFYNLPTDYLDTYTANIEAVTTADIKKAFDRNIHLEQMLLVSVGKM